MNKIKYFLVVQLLLSFCLCEISKVQKEKLLNGFKEYYNSLPNQAYRSEEGSLLSTQQVDDTTYQIVASIRVAEINNAEATKLLKCTATIKDSDNDVTIINNNCEESVEQEQSTDENQETTLETQVEVSEPTVVRKPVQLVNEVQADTGIASGEQFIAIPRDQPNAPCVGCASHVNPQAAGVSDLANLGVRHLDLHEPSVKHSLESVIDVERQVQVVNGVRYVLTLSINSNHCTEVESENCASSKTCKITILVKPWVKLSSGGNYRAILANNCTEEWQYGDNGEVLPELSADNNQNTGNASVDPSDTTAFDGDIQVKHNTNVESQPNQERSLTEEDIKKIQEQIISNTQFQETNESSMQSFTLSPDVSNASKQHVFKVESGNHNENSIPVTESEKTEQASNINLDKRKAIDEMLDFFDFSGFKPKSEDEDAVPRVKRSYDYDLQVLSLAKDFHGIKNSIENARFMYKMAQAMVDYLNEIDLEVKNRAVKNVMRAEEETENLQRFIYIQARVTIPCDKVGCEPRDVNAQICNGVIECSNENSPQILNTFCYNDNKESEYREGIKEIALDDPVLRTMAEDAVKKIESDSKSQYAMKIYKIASAITQVTSGTLTKFSVIVESIKCNKSVPLPLRINCTVLEQLGSKICDVIVHERHWLKEKKISYTCTERPTDMRISKSQKVSKNVTVDDPEIIEMLQEAIQYLESQSDKTNKLKIVNVKSISSQIIAGFLTKIEFVAGYTDCTDENYPRDQMNKCELLKGEGLRSCRAQIWDRSWIMDGRQIGVSCDDDAKTNEIVNTRKKRSIDSASNQEQQSSNKDNDVDYKKLASESLFKFMQSSSSHQHYEVVKVDKAIVQDISRKLIKIDFTISPTDCLIQNDGILSSPKCNIVNPKNILHCHSKILENNWIDKKQYFVKCNIKYQQQNNTNVLKERNPSDSKYYQLAEESLAKYLHDTGNPHHIIVRVEKVTTQIVSGLLTRIDFIISPKNHSVSNSKTVRCHSEILEKRWTETKLFNVSCQMEKKGHLVKINMDNPKYMQIAVEALQKYIKDKPESKLVRVAFVDKVEQKGDTIKIEFIASHAEEDDGDTFCYAKVTETRESKSDIEVKCYLIGKIYRKAEIIEDDPNYYKYIQLADESLRNYLQKINSSLYTLVSIESVTVQWDKGIKTLINFTISAIDSEHSGLIEGKQCIAEILEQPQLHKKNIDVKCELEKDLYRTKRRASNARVRRQLTLGGVKEHDPSNPEYKALAEESLRKYVIDSGITQPLQVARIEKVTTQVVSGTLTRIDFLVSGSLDSETIKCHSKVWERPWLKSKEIDVSCDNDKHLRGKRELVGGPKDQDPTESRYKALAEESLRKYVIDSGITQPLQVARIEKVTTQVVSGTLTRIDFLVSGSPDSETIKCHSKVWERPWLKSKEIDVSCDNDKHLRGKRELVGGPKDQDPTESRYKALAEESLRKYVIDSGITQPLQVARIEKVTTQVVSGTLTRIDFLVSGSPDSETIKCHSQVWNRPWLNSKEINVSCDNDKHLRGKRQLVGGPKDQDPTESRYKALAEESLRKYAIDSSITEPLEVAHVERVTTQVVSGMVIRIDFLVSGSPYSEIIKCHSEVWERPWLKLKDTSITVSCENDGHRGKRQAGGSVDQDPAEPQYKAMAEESLRKYIIDAGISQPLEVARVERVTTAVVAGIVTSIDFLICGSSDSKIIKCHSNFWNRPWLNSEEIKVSCEDDGHLRGKRQLVGGPKDQNPAEPRYIALAEESLRKYAIDSGITEPLEVAHVLKVTTQVVSGTVIRIDFLVSGSPNSVTLKCHSEVWDRPWLRRKDISITVSCENDGHRGKRQIPGGISEVDPTAPQYKALAEESLRKYMIDFAIAQPLEVVQVVRVTTQIVAGSVTRIDFLVSGGQDSQTIKCHSEVWERPWLNSKEIKVSCENDGHKGKRQMPGGISEVDPTAPQYKALAEESLRKYMIDFAIAQPLEVLQVVRVTTQTVAGSVTRIDFLVSGGQDSQTIKCHSEVWERPWLNSKEIKVSCENDGHKGKRQLPGGISEVDPTAPQYKALAEESLRKYMIDFAIAQPLEVLQVVRVTTQTVAGSVTRIDFLVSGGQDSQRIKCHSEVWERPWLNSKEIKVSCENDGHRGKRQVPGGISKVDPTAPQYKALAEESLRKYMIDFAIAQPLEVVKVESVTTQVVAGSMTRIVFLVSGGQDSKTIKCNSEVWEQGWRNFKEIKVSCENDGHRGKRQVPGGISKVDPTAPQYKALAEESLRKYMIDFAIAQPLEVVKVESVTTQVVAGSMTRIVFLVSGGQDSKTIKCNSEVWEQVWRNFKEIKVSCENDGHRGKRQVPGGISEVDPTAPQYKALAEESLRKYMIDFAIAQPLEVVKVESVTTQVVAGSMTRIVFLVSGGQDSKTIKCNSEVWEQGWRNFKEIKVSCENDGHRGKRQVPGGISKVDTTAPQYKALAEESLRKYMIDFAIAQPLEVVKVESVTTQVVAGSMTRIVFLVSGGQDSKTIKCNSEVWEQVWRNFKEIKVSCENDGHRGKRQVPGGISEVDPTAPQYKALAEESLRKYMIDFAIAQPLEVVQVVRVTTQTVAGSVTRIDFLVSGGQDSKTIKCNSEVWEQGWRNFKEIKVSCENDGHRGKRQVPGGISKVDPTAPQYKALAEESLRKYMIDFAIAQPLEVVQVVRVTTQIVAGSVTRIDFLVSGGQDSKTIKCNSEVWEQGWRNLKEIKVSCENDGHRGKRQVPGGISKVDPTAPQYKALAEESLRKYMIDFAIAQPLEVVKVESVTTQVVAGSMTRIVFLVSGGQDSKTIKCNSEVWEQVWRNFKEIKVSCENDGHRGKRQVPGGISEVDPTAPQYKALAEESLRKYMIDFAIAQPLEVVQVVRVTTQIVAGSVTRIDFLVSGGQDSKTIKCHSEVLERPWLKEKDFKVDCLEIKERVKRDLRLAGGVSEESLITSQNKESIRGNSSSKGQQRVGDLRGHGEEEQDPNKPEYKLLAEESLRKLYQKKTTVYHKVVEMHRVVTRVVSGLKYKIDFTAAPTACSVNVSSTRARSCKADDDVLLYCHSDIWDQPWLNKKKIDIQCNDPTYDNDDFADYESDSDLSLKPSEPQKNNVEKYIKLAEEASEKYLTISNRKYVHKVTKILSISEQVANGTLTIDYTLSPTTCLRNETTNNTSCKLKQPLVVFNCNANIRQWLQVEKEIKVTCKKNSNTNGKKPKRKSGVRNIREIDDDDDELDEDTTYYYADRAVQHINDKSNSNNLHKLISIHAVQSSVQMGTLTVKMYIEVAETFCLRHHKSKDLRNCEEMGGSNHRLCLARVWPSPDDELIVRHVSVVCDDEEDFVSITGVNIPELIRLSVAYLESPPENKFKLVHQGEPQVIPSLDSRRPFKLNFVVSITNCSKDVNLDKNPFQCYLNPNIPMRKCHAYIWLRAEAKYIINIDAQCTPVALGRFKRSALDLENVTLDNSEIQKMVTASLEQLEMQSLHRYKQRVLQINSHSTKISSGKVTTIDFDVGYTSCLKYEWVANITNCNFLDHLPRRRCVAQIWERLWISNGKNIDVNCVDDETPLESHIEFESAEMANELAKQALKHIEAKYPHPSKQKVVRIFSLEKQVVAGIHYKMKVEVGFTDCLALSDQKDCKLVKNHGLNKFCRVNVWIRPWTDHPPNFRVSCDFQEGTTRDLYHHVQAEHLFFNFLTTYSPSYVNNYSQMHKRFEIFKNNIKKIHELNVHEKGTAVYGVTRFTDLSYEEFRSTYMGLKTNLTNENQVPMKQADIPNIKVPPNFDWRDYDAVTDVKDQGSCGSCWAFSVTGNIEGQWKMQSGKLVSLSEQELVDCDKLDDGCNGGLPDNAYRAIEQMGGLELESDYPYEGTDDKCVFNKTLAKVQISSAVNITTNETGMAQWLAHNGPISIGINANAMQFYMGGISHPWKMLCNPTNLDHGVLIVGFGVKDYPLFHKQLPYWIIKNSWGKSWGEQGYYRVYRGDGTCGVNQMASSAVI